MVAQPGLQIIGYFLIPLGLIALFTNIRYLVYLVIFFAGFTATSVYNFGNIYGLQPSYYFALLFILKYGFMIMRKGRMYKPNNLLSLFMIISVLSFLLLAVVKTRDVMIINQQGIYTNVVFNIKNITQLLTLIFCFVVYWFMKDYFSNHPQEISVSIKILVYSAVLIGILGFYQELAYIKGWSFDPIFRNGLHGNVQPYGSFVRVYAVAGEPSMLAYFLAPIFALLLSVPKQTIKHRVAIILFILVSGVITTSTTFILGLVVLVMKIIMDKIISLLRLRDNKNQKIGLVLPVVLMAMIPVVLIIVSFNPVIHHLLITGVLNKLQGHGQSGMERVLAFQTQLNAALKYPLLGVGYGSARSKDLLSTWLGNVGFIGTGMFLIYLYILVSKLKYTDKLGYSVSNYIVVLFVSAFVSVSEPYYLFIWAMLAMGEGLLLRKRKPIQKRLESTLESYNLVTQNGSE